MDEGWRRPGEMQKLFDNGRHKEAKPGCKVLPSKKHCVVFSTQSGLIRLLHRQGCDDAACRRHPSGRFSLATRLISGSRLLTSRHSTSKGGEKTKVSPKP